MKNKKLLILLPILTLMLAGCGGSNSGSKDPSPNPIVINVEGVSLDKTTLEIEVGASTNLNATVSPSNASNTGVTWSSSDTNVATVSNLGKVTGVAVGTATITVTTKDGSKTATCAVTVSASGTKYGSLDNPLSVAEALNLANEECAESGAFTADNVYVKGYLINSPSYKSGTSGTYVQNAYLADADDKDATSILAYTINYANDSLIPYQHDLIIIHGYITNYNGSTIEFSTYNKSEYTYVDQIVTRGNSTISYVYEDEQVTLSENAASVINGQNTSFKVEANNGYKIDSVTVNGDAIEANNDAYSFLVIKDTTVIINSSQVGVELKTAEMYYSGETTNMVKGQNNANLVNLNANLFNVSTDKKSCSTECGLNAAGQIRLYNQKKETGDGGELIISSTKATIKKIAITFLQNGDQCAIYAGDSTTAAIVGEGGVYKIDGSTVTIKNVSTSDVSAQVWIEKVVITYALNEIVNATGVSLSEGNLTLKEGGEATLIATLEPANATDNIEWLSSDEKVATVEDGKVTAIAAGSATITAYADANENGELDEGEFKAECALTVASAKKVGVASSYEVGVKYKFGLYQGTNEKTIYSTGAIASNYGVTTTDFDEGADFELVEVSEGNYNIKVTLADETVKYMNIVAASQGKYINVKFDDEATSVWTYNEDYNTFVTVISDDELSASYVSKAGTYYVGTYNNFETLSPSLIKFAATSFVGHFYELA